MSDCYIKPDPRDVVLFSAEELALRGIPDPAFGDLVGEDVARTERDEALKGGGK